MTSESACLREVARAFSVVSAPVTIPWRSNAAARSTISSAECAARFTGWREWAEGRAGLEEDLDAAVFLGTDAFLGAAVFLEGLAAAFLVAAVVFLAAAETFAEAALALRVAADLTLDAVLRGFF